MNEYKGIKIYDNVIIVENSMGQGYVVNYNDPKMLENALNWARSWEYEKDENNNLIEDGVDIWGRNKYKRKEIEGTIHNYENGQFKLKLYDSAGGSSQGGSLSFWNCTVIAPDDKTYIIGIDSELLLKLLKNTTVIKGEVQENVWLGREKNKTGIYTETMEDFAQAKLDEEIRNTMKKKTSKYEVGDIVETITHKEAYLGEAYQYFELDTSHLWDVNLIFYKKPRKVHIFKEIGYSWYNIYQSKPSRVVTGKKYNGEENLNTWYNYITAENSPATISIFYSHVNKIKYRLGPNLKLNRDNIVKSMKEHFKNNHLNIKEEE